MQTVMVLIAERRETDSLKTDSSYTLNNKSRPGCEIPSRESGDRPPPFWTWFIENPRPSSVS